MYVVLWDLYWRNLVIHVHMCHNKIYDYIFKIYIVPLLKEFSHRNSCEWMATTYTWNHQTSLLDISNIYKWPMAPVIYEFSSMQHMFSSHSTLLWLKRCRMLVAFWLLNLYHLIVNGKFGYILEAFGKLWVAKSRSATSRRNWLNL